jgi:hypothetical protein
MHKISQSVDNTHINTPWNRHILQTNNHRHNNLLPENHPIEHKMATFRYITRMHSLPLTPRMKQKEWTSIQTIARNNNFPPNPLQRLVLSAHVKSYHVGVQGLLSLLREMFWILRGWKSVWAILSKCVRCRRHEARLITTSQPVFLEPRVRRCGVRNDGCWYGESSFPERWSEGVGFLYTCAVYLELALSLSTDSFIQTLRRFVAQRGSPAIVYSDNETNFMGLDNAFAHFELEQISKHCAIEQIEWRFNPPAAAWWGGWWERLITPQTIAMQDPWKSFINTRRIGNGIMWLWVRH